MSKGMGKYVSDASSWYAYNSTALPLTAEETVRYDPEDFEPLIIGKWKLEKNYYGFQVSHKHGKVWTKCVENDFGEWLCLGCPIDDLEPSPEEFTIQIQIQKMGEKVKGTGLKVYTNSFYVSFANYTNNLKF